MPQNDGCGAYSRGVRLRNLVILWLVVAVALFVLIPGGRVVAQFVWDAYLATPESIETEDGVVFTHYALVVGPTAYLPYLWIAAGLLGLMVYLVRARRG